MIGVLLFGAGAVLMWAAFTGRGDAVLNALHVDLPAAGNYTPPTSGSGDGTHNTSGASQADSGSHMGIDPATGLTVTINKPYGDMTNSEKDAANLYAHLIGNVGSGNA